MCVCNHNNVLYIIELSDVKTGLQNNCVKECQGHSDEWFLMTYWHIQQLQATAVCSWLLLLTYWHTLHGT